MRPVLVCAIVLSFSLTALSQTYVDVGGKIAIDPERGADPRVDYSSLLQFGPWDDRNYDLTAEDLELLAPNEAELDDLTPAFFRVGMRRNWTSLPRSGPAQYPLHAYPTFLAMFGGFQVDGALYTRVRRVGDRLLLVREPEAPETGAGDGPGIDAVQGEVRITAPAGAAESAIKIHPADTSRVIAGSNGPGGGQKMWYSSDGGSSWTQSSLPLGGTNGDPAVEWSSSGQYAYTTTLGNCSFFGCAVWFYRSADNGQTWTSLESITPGSPRRQIVASNGDREYIHVDKSPSSPFKDRIYVFFHQSNIMKIARSADLGNTFSIVSFSSLSEERGICGDVTTNPQGHVFYIWPAFNSQRVLVKKSTDGGVTFGDTQVISNTNASFTYRLPSQDSRNAAIYVSADADLTNGPFRGSIYAAWGDTTGPESSIPAENHSRITVARSRDGGASWQFSTPHESADQLQVDRYHQFLAVGPDGVVHVVYYDSRRDPTRQAVDVFYSYSNDGAVTWSTPRRVTTRMSPNLTDGFEFGDYNGLDIVASNLIAIYTDNRNEAGGTGDSKDVYGIGITPGAVSGAGHVPDGRYYAGDPLTVERVGADLALAWSPACGGGEDYAVYEGQLGVDGSFASRTCSTGGATSTLLSPSDGSRSYVIVPLLGSSEGSYGKRSDGTERDPSATACAAQVVNECP